MHNPTLTALYYSLVRRFGGQDAVAALHEAEFGAGNKSTICRMCNGTMAVTGPAILVLERALGVNTISAWMAEQNAAEAPKGSITKLTASASQHAASVVAEVIAATSPDSEGGCEITEAERAGIEALATQLSETVEKLRHAARSAA